MIAWLVGAALAAELPELALLPLDAVPGTPQAALDRTVRGVSAAVQARGGVIAVYDTDLAGRLGTLDDLAAARDALTEGRRLLQEGDADLAIAFIQQAVTAHVDSGSEIVRRPEVADAYYTLARAQIATGDRDKARAALRRALVLVPDYLDTRADSIDDATRALADEVTAALAARPPRATAPESAAALASQLGVDCVAHGTVSAEGTLAITVQRGAEVRYVARRAGPFAPPRMGDPWYSGLAGQIVAACVGEPVPAWVEPAVAVVDPLPPPDDPVLPPVDPIPNNPHPRRGTSIAAATLTVLLMGAAGGGAAWFLLPTPAESQPATWTITVTPP